MTTFLYTTTSDSVEITDTDAVRELVDEYSFTIPPTVVDDHISFFADSEPEAFDVYDTSKQENSVEEEFFSRLLEYLTEEFNVKCVQVKGQGETEAFHWTVTPQGLVKCEEIGEFK
jgi:hypothetical protein